MRLSKRKPCGDPVGDWRGGYPGHHGLQQGRLVGAEELERVRQNMETQALLISAKNAAGIGALLETIGRELFSAYVHWMYCCRKTRGIWYLFFMKKGTSRNLNTPKRAFASWGICLKSWLRILRLSSEN
jgi:hypothetical protein